MTKKSRSEVTIALPRAVARSKCCSSEAESSLSSAAVTTSTLRRLSPATMRAFTHSSA